MDFTAKLQKFTTFLALFAILAVPLVFSGKLNSSFSLPEAAFFRITTALLALCLILYFLKTKTRPDFKAAVKSSIGFFFMLYFGTQIFAAVSGIAPVISIFGGYFRQQGLATQLHYALFAVILAVISQLPAVKEKFPKYLLWTISTGGALPAFYGLLQKIGIDPLFETWASAEFFGRIFSTLGQPNFLGQFLLLTIGASVALYLTQQKGRLNKLLLFFIFVQIAALLLTGSRSSYLGFWGLLFILFLGISWMADKKAGILLTVFVFIILPAAILFSAIKFIDTADLPPTSLLSRFTMTGEGLRSVKTRVMLWPMAFKMFLDRPFFGQGPEAFQLTFTKYQDPRLLSEEFYTGFSDRAHNFIFDNLAAIGIVGLIAYLGLLAAIFVKIFHSIRAEKASADSKMLLCLGAALAGFLFADLFSFQVIPHSVFLWSCLIAILLPLKIPLVHHEHIRRRSITAAFAVICLLALSADIYFLNIKPLLADYYFQKGIVESLTYPNESKGHFEKAKSLNPFEPLYALYDGRAKLDQLKNDENAEKAKLEKQISDDLKILYSLTPQNHETYLFHAAFAEAEAESAEEDEGEKRMETAEKMFDKAVESAPNFPPALFSAGDFYYRHANYAQATKIYERILEISPVYWKWSFEELADKPLYERERYRIFFKNHSEFRDIFLKLGRSLTMLEQYEQALYYLDFGGDTVDVLSTKATIYAKLKDYKKAIEATKKALEIEPEDELLLKNLGKLKKL